MTMTDDEQARIDEHWMQQALVLAEKAEQQGEVPVGAVIVVQNEMVGVGWNQPITCHDPTAHAEVVALRDAGQSLKNYRITVNSTLYVTLEPCVMCMGAISHARINRLVFGAEDPKRGAVCSALELTHAPFLNHHVPWQGGVLAEQCGNLLKQFFQRRR